MGKIKRFGYNGSGELVVMNNRGGFVQYHEHCRFMNEANKEIADLQRRLAEAEDEAQQQAAIVGSLGEQVDSLTGKLERAEAERDEAIKERDAWHEDRDRVLREQLPWMEMVEAVYRDKEYDFGEALAKIISERNNAMRCLEKADRIILDERVRRELAEEARDAALANQAQTSDLLVETQREVNSLRADLERAEQVATERMVAYNGLRAVVAQVQEWRDENMVSELHVGPWRLVADLDDVAKLDAILSSQQKVLAVVDGYFCGTKRNPFRIDGHGEYFPFSSVRTYAEPSGKPASRRATVIVIESSGE